jgi:ATPase subunit of ABC transporter with duplicated ATPase domains
VDNIRSDFVQKCTIVRNHDRAFLNEVATDIIHQHSERLDYYRGANFGKLHENHKDCARVTLKVVGKESN